MPATLTYPGVYIEEIPSGVHTITGVATSIAAFIGWTAKGPIDDAGLVLSWSDFERQFGGLDARSVMSYAVSHFFLNGGQEAYIVRLVTTSSATASDNAAASEVSLDGKLKIKAANPGKWGNDYAIVTKKRADDATRFSLSVQSIKDNPKGTTVESFGNLSMKTDDARYVVNVLKNGSSYVIGEVLGAATDPPADTVIPVPPDPNAGVIPNSAKLAGGADGLVLKPNAADFETAVLNVAQEDGLLDRVDLFNILCVPDETKATVLSSLQQFCVKRRAMLVVDCTEDATFSSVTISGITGKEAINAAFYFPRVNAPDPLQEMRPRTFPTCGLIAGIFARTDVERGVWKAPAGIEASLTGISALTQVLTDKQNGVLNKKGINCLRTFPASGTVSWGARTLRGDDEIGSEWKYIPVRRTALFIEETLYRALKWVVFEPNDEPLWAQIRLNVGAFMHDLFRQGAFQGQTPKDAYFVKCDKETTTQNDINKGIVNILVGFAPLKPAEFVVIQLQQMAGQIQT